jgi:uncharacterized protein YkwD
LRRWRIGKFPTCTRATAVTTRNAVATAVPASSLSAPASAAGFGNDASCGLNSAAGFGNDASCGLNAPHGIQAEILQRFNALRATGAVCGAVAYPPSSVLSWNTTLLQAAKGHATDMATKNYFSHTGLDGRSAAESVLAAGYSYGRTGENTAAGQATVKSVMAARARSESHCQNMMTPDYRDIGVACVRNDAADCRIYWVMEMGRPL